MDNLIYVGVRISKKQAEFLKSVQKKFGFVSLSETIRFIIHQYELKEKGKKDENG